jgi:aminoglycoside phosphotransferase (APT) family kinase protein
VKAPPGVAVDAVSRWLTDAAPALSAPLAFELVAGGNSNLTFVVTDATGQMCVLRRPPLGHVLPTAHDMAREYRILTALAGTDVPVPHTLALCTDASVTGAPFYVMNHVAGSVVRDVDAARRLTPGDRAAVTHGLADTLAAIHRVDPASVGLGDLGRTSGYIQRQLSRWHTQLDAIKVRPLPALDEVHTELLRRRPAEPEATIVHGDFRLENCIVDERTIRAVLDWELCTLGDPMADLGMLMVYWAAPTDDIVPFADVPTLAGGFPTRAELLDRYAAARGVELPDVTFYIAFAYWRLACISEGVYARYLHGDMGDQRGRAAQFEQGVHDLAMAAEQVLDGRWKGLS